jgi:hypothetical protein
MYALSNRLHFPKPTGVHELNKKNGKALLQILYPFSSVSDPGPEVIENVGAAKLGT